ncbi:MAG: hypothetical protein ACREQ3_26325, partial [Candidatus Binatia bacterium]
YNRVHSQLANSALTARVPSANSSTVLSSLIQWCISCMRLSTSRRHPSSVILHIGTSPPVPTAMAGDDKLGNAVTFIETSII